MARIAAVEAWGFQSLFNCRFTLAPNGLTVITGPNDSGKTALIRLIRWIALGEPQGEDFLFTIYDDLDKTKIIEQAEEAGGRIILDDGVTITKIRRKGETTWIISTEPEPYKKAAVPEVVTQLLGLTKTNFSDFEVALNFAYQLDAPFLISESPSAGAKVLGKLAGTEVVDLALKDVAKDVSKHQTARRNAEQEMGAKELELMNYQGLEEIGQQLDALEILLKKIDDAVTRKDKLRDISIRYGAALAALETLGAELDRLAVVPDLEKDLAEIEKAQQRYDTLLDLYDRYGKATATVEQLTDRLKDFQGLEIAAQLLQLVENNAKRLATLAALNQSYQKITQDANKAAETLEQLKHLDKAAQDLEKIEIKYARLTILKALSTRHQEADAQVKRYTAALEGTEHTEEAARIIAGLADKVARLGKLKALWVRYQSTLHTCQRAEEALKQANTDYWNADDELKQAWKDAGGICPLCGQEIAEGGMC